MNACQHSSYIDRPSYPVAVVSYQPSGGLWALLMGLVPKSIDAVRFICDRDDACSLRVRIIGVHAVEDLKSPHISAGLRSALERGFVRFLNRSHRNPFAGEKDIWEWSSRIKALTHSRHRGPLYPQPP